MYQEKRVQLRWTWADAHIFLLPAMVVLTAVYLFFFWASQLGAVYWWDDFRHGIDRPTSGFFFVYWCSLPAASIASWAAYLMRRRGLAFALIMAPLMVLAGLAVYGWLIR